MKISAGQLVLLTGASGGLGVYMARAFATRGANLALVAYPGTGLEDLRKEVQQLGVRAVALASDLRDPSERRKVVEQVSNEFGPIQILVNNAGVEFTSAYHELSEENIHEIIGVNLEAAMVLTRLVLPEMLRRAAGHIVSISSLAGRSGPAFQEPYAATKAGLVAFTSSLRATYRRQGVSASVVTPGFVEAGIYANLKARSGCSAPGLLGTSTPETVARAVIRAVEKDVPEIIVNPLPVRPLLALSALMPVFGERIINQIGTNDFFRRVVEAEKRHQTAAVVATQNRAT
jgi:short-subunit dehydrogenase